MERIILSAEFLCPCSERRGEEGSEIWGFQGPFQLIRFLVKG